MPMFSGSACRCMPILMPVEPAFATLKQSTELMRRPSNKKDLILGNREKINTYVLLSSHLENCSPFVLAMPGCLISKNCNACKLLQYDLYLPLPDTLVFLLCQLTAVFTNMRILKFKSQLTIWFFAAVNHLNGPFRKQNFTLTIKLCI